MPRHGVAALFQGCAFHKHNIVETSVSRIGKGPDRGLRLFRTWLRDVPDCLGSLWPHSYAMNTNEPQQHVRIVVVGDGPAEFERALQLRRRLGPNASILIRPKTADRLRDPTKTQRRSLAA